MILCRRNLKKQSWWSWEEKQTQYNTTWSGFWTQLELFGISQQQENSCLFFFLNKILSNENFIEFWSAYLQSVTAGEMDHQTHVGTPTSAGIGGDERGMERAKKEEAQMTKDGRRRWNTLCPQAASTYQNTPAFWFFWLLPATEYLTGTHHDRSSDAGKSH